MKLMDFIKYGWRFHKRNPEILLLTGLVAIWAFYIYTNTR